jgi:hypothetical protein
MFSGANVTWLLWRRDGTRRSEVLMRQVRFLTKLRF